VIGSPIAVGEFPYGLALDPIHSRMYVVNHVDGSVSVIDTNTNTVVGSPLLVGDKTISNCFCAATTLTNF
jgi:DNA-binding beta-propeller fold protein YncE